MVSRISLAVVVAAFLALILAFPVLAGGWAVITLDALPGEVAAGEPLNIGFTVRQHGRTLMDDLTPTITARLSGSNKAVVVNAAPEGQVGHYSALLTIPEPGTWEWSIEAFSMNQPMPPLTVVAAPGQKPPQPVSNSPLVAWLAGISALAGCLAGAILAFRRRIRLAVPLFVTGLALGLFGFISAAQPAPSPQVLAAAPAANQAALGEQLFLAKGCTTCHVHPAIHRTKDTMYVDAGPSLAVLPRPNPEYLQTWLKDPKSIKPTTEMPDLGLSQVEIEALIAFLTSK